MHKRDLCCKITPVIVAVLLFDLMVGFAGTLPGGCRKPDVPVSSERRRSGTAFR